MILVWLMNMCLNETYGKVRIGKHLSDVFSIWNGLLFNFALELPLGSFR
jgi:hypothetical protein